MRSDCFLPLLREAQFYTWLQAHGVRAYLWKKQAGRLAIGSEGVRASGGPDGSPTFITQHESNDLAAPIASGSFRLQGTAIVPCSMSTLGALASGTCTHLIHRAGAVALKEGWPLILVPRETPLSLVSIRAMAQLKEAGAVILPASPSFYSKPSSIESLVDTVVYRILDQLQVADKNTSRSD